MAERTPAGDALQATLRRLDEQRAEAARQARVEALRREREAEQAAYNAKYR